MALSDPGKGRIIEQGEGLVKITLAEACKAGDILGYSSGWKRALATVGTAIQGRLVAGEDGASGDEVTAYRRAKSLNPENKETYYGLGLAYRNRDLNDERRTRQYAQVSKEA